MQPCLHVEFSSFICRLVGIYACTHTGRDDAWGINAVHSSSEFASVSLRFMYQKGCVCSDRLCYICMRQGEPSM
jgi:hypothetical protein